MREFDFKEFIKIQGAIEKEEETYYWVSEYVLDALVHGKQELGFTGEYISVNRTVYAIQVTREVYCNTALWTKYWEVWWFKYKNYFIGYKVSPRVSGIYHLVSKKPVKIIKASPEKFEKIARKLFPPPYPIGKCPYCGSSSSDIVGYEWGLFDREKPTVPKYQCRKCGMQFFKTSSDLYDIYRHWGPSSYWFLKLSRF